MRNKHIKIKIECTINLKFVPKRRFLFWWIKIYNSEFDNINACLQWVRKKYANKYFNSRSSTYFEKELIYNFYPEYRDQIDIDFL